MSIYDYNYSYFATYLLPVYRRLTKHLALITAWLSPLDWNRNNVFNLSMKGSLGYNYENAITYLKGQYANYGGSTYECIVTSSIGVLPTNTANWLKVVQNMVGYNERIVYNGTVKPLEYMLYRYFGNIDNTINFDTIITNSSSPKSIYFTQSSIPSSFIVNNTFGSAVYSNEIGGGDSVFETFTPTTIHFTVNVPNSVQIANGGTTPTTNTIKGLVNKYKIAGVNFSIVYY